MANKKKSMLRSTLIVLCVVLGMIFTTLLAGTVYAEYLLGQMHYVSNETPQPSLSIEDALAMQETDPTEVDSTIQEQDPEDVNLGEKTDVIIGGENSDLVNILLIGADYQSGDVARSDTMILCTFNKVKKTITMTSFMRDMYVEIPKYGKSRLNVSYTWGGMQLLKETLEYNFGVQIDGMVEIDFTNFAKMIDMMGGVEITLTSDQASFINIKNGSSLKAGTTTLTGNEALWYARYRGDAGRDFNRTSRQRELLNLLLDRYRNLKLTELITWMDDLLPMVTTDMSKADVIGYAVSLFPMLSEAEFVSQRIPVEGEYYQARINGMAVLVPDIPGNIKVLVDTLSTDNGSVG